MNCFEYFWNLIRKSMAAAGGAGSGTAAAPEGEDRYGDVWPRFRMGAQIERSPPLNSFDEGNTGRYIKLNPEALKWDRYFIYKHAIHSVHIYGDVHVTERYKVDGLLIDNYGQSYFINMLLPNGKNYLKTDIILTPDYEHFQKLTNAQIDYVKGIANTLEKNGFDLKTIALSKLFADIDSIKTQMHELSAVRRERNELQGRINTATRSFARLQANIAARNRSRAAEPANNDPRAAPRRHRNTRRSRK